MTMIYTCTNKNLVMDKIIELERLDHSKNFLSI